MKHQDWREIVEVLCVISIVASLLLVALELREANRITTKNAEIELQLAFRSQLLGIGDARIGNAETARLYAKMAAPRSQLITATDQVQMQSLARQFLGVLQSAQFAHDEERIPAGEIDYLSGKLAAMIDGYPGLRPYLVAEYERIEKRGNYAVFAPLAGLSAELEGDASAAP